MQPISNTQITIRPFQDADMQAYVTAVGESVTVLKQWMSWVHDAYSEQDAATWFAMCRDAMVQRTAYDMGIFMTDTGELLGGAGINQINWQHKIGNIGYWVRASAQNRGIATQAVQLLREFGFQQLKLVRLEIVILLDNTTSRRIAEKVGATYECIAQNRLLHHGVPKPAAMYALVDQ